ncbi:sulfotransferase family protein [Roseovarius amoyensis]|uniref:sulfotransferase family protein n=1 Tax=Roseovarius amoyensis TaxID=2211448 RepID=UPI000DBE47F6|nr:sulfotransferase [Roseovarius amoyensis]
MKSPDFFIIGAPKCGTSSLAWWLSQHPQVWFSRIKEPHFFNDDSEFRQFRARPAYEELFAGAGPEHMAAGEASTWYLLSDTAVPNIEEYTGQTARYIVCLRDPVTMMPALHRQLLFSGTETEQDIRRAWAMQEARAKGDDLPAGIKAPVHLQYKNACSLGWMCQRLLQRVPRERVHFVFTEDMAGDPQGSYRAVLRFLGLSENPGDVLLEAVNTAHAPKSRAISALIGLGGIIQRGLGLRTGKGFLRRLRQINRRKVARKPLPPGFEAELRAAFAEDIALLQRVTGRDLSHWQEPQQPG